MSVLCPKCQREGRIFDTRLHGQLRWRRRECLKCGERWSTWEVGGDDEVRNTLTKNDQYRQAIADIRAVLGRLITKEPKNE